MPEVHMMCGIAGSGKSHLALSLAEKYAAVYISSDEIRKQWYGDASIQGDNSAVFTEIRTAVRQALNKGKSVIYDATNLSRRRRIHFIRNDVRKFNVTAHMLCPSITTCLERNKDRDRQVKEDVIHHMYKSFEIPFKEEGFEQVHYYPEIPKTFKGTQKLESLLMQPVPYVEFFNQFNQLEGFTEIYELPHDTKKHHLSVSRHLYHTLLEAEKAFPHHLPLKLLWTCILHDIGKGETKSFLRFNGEVRKYAGYEGHENVSAYLAIRNLHYLGYSPAFACSVAKLIQFHHSHAIPSKKQKKQAALILNENERKELAIFREWNANAN